MTETNGLESKEAHDTDISKFGKVSFTIVEACTAIWTMEEEKARCIASIWADDNGIEWKKSDEASDQLGHDQAWLIDRPSMG
ncbi:hypothetical protein T09_12949 [Trichinella sp. T9]|nr:hypothetical protein T09_12949 [Trichinella sp. T9]